MYTNINNSNLYKCFDVYINNIKNKRSDNMRITGEAYICDEDGSARIPIELTDKEEDIFFCPKTHTDDEQDIWNRKEVRIINKIVKDTGINLDDYNIDWPVIEAGEYILSVIKKRSEKINKKYIYENIDAIKKELNRPRVDKNYILEKINKIKDEFI